MKGALLKPSRPLSDPLPPESGVSYTGGKPRKNKPSLLGGASPFFLRAVGNICFHFCRGWFSLCPPSGAAFSLILDPINRVDSALLPGKLFIISNKHGILASICHPLFVSQFVRNSGGKRGAIYWPPSKTSNIP